MRCFFHCFWIFLGKNPPCCDVWFVRFGKGGALHVSCILFDISWIIWSSVVHAVCHWVLFSWLVSNVFVSSFIFNVFSS